MKRNEAVNMMLAGWIAQDDLFYKWRYNSAAVCFEVQVEGEWNSHDINDSDEKGWQIYMPAAHGDMFEMDMYLLPVGQGDMSEIDMFLSAAKYNGIGRNDSISMNRDTYLKLAAEIEELRKNVLKA